MQKKTMAGLVSVVIIIAGIALHAALRHAPPGSGPVSPDGKIVEHAAYYDINAAYATSTPLAQSVGKASDAQVVRQMKNFVADTIAQFKKDGNFANLTSEDLKTLGLDRGDKETLDISYMTASSPRTVSYLFTISEFTLGAHSNTFFRTYSYDTKTGTLLALSDLFIPNATYLDMLSAISRAKLPSIIDKASFNQSMMEDGTKPEETSFANFFLDGHSLVLLFPPYQVAPYSAGAQTLAIPLTDLKSILKPEYQ